MKVLPFLLFTLFTDCKTLYLNKLSVNNDCLPLFLLFTATAREFLGLLLE